MFSSAVVMPWWAHISTIKIKSGLKSSAKQHSLFILYGRLWAFVYLIFKVSAVPWGTGPGLPSGPLESPSSWSVSVLFLFHFGDWSPPSACCCVASPSYGCCRSTASPSLRSSLCFSIDKDSGPFLSNHGPFQVFCSFSFCNSCWFLLLISIQMLALSSRSFFGKVERNINLVSLRNLASLKRVDLSSSVFSPITSGLFFSPLGPTLLEKVATSTNVISSFRASKMLLHCSRS